MSDVLLPKPPGPVRGRPFEKGRSGNPGGPACSTTGMKKGSCVVCQIDADCMGTAAPHCDVVANQCVACLTSADCSAPTAVCNASQLCVGCLTSADCTRKISP